MSIVHSTAQVFEPEFDQKKSSWTRLILSSKTAFLHLDVHSSSASSGASHNWLLTVWKKNEQFFKIFEFQNFIADIRIQLEKLSVLMCISTIDTTEYTREYTESWFFHLYIPRKRLNWKINICLKFKNTAANRARNGWTQTDHNSKLSDLNGQFMIHFSSPRSPLS